MGGQGRWAPGGGDVGQRRATTRGWLGRPCTTATVPARARAHALMPAAWRRRRRYRRGREGGGPDATLIGLLTLRGTVWGGENGAQTPPRGRARSAGATREEARGLRVTHTGTYAHASPRRLQFAQIGRPSHFSLRPGRHRRRGQYESVRRRTTRGEEDGSPRQKVHAMGVRRGVRRGKSSPSESSLFPRLALLNCTNRARRGQGAGWGGEGRGGTHHCLHGGKISVEEGGSKRKGRGREGEGEGGGKAGGAGSKSEQRLLYGCRTSSPAGRGLVERTRRWW
ncbi:hypothetical protein BC628DRAFT_36922 [Trametes gibbosa]|nr:hypothetical protein BC628DRAFT_36922 [Trametes gibbosa]